MTELCWEEKTNEKYCKNYRLDGKTKCRHHNVDNYIRMYLMMSFLVVTLTSLCYYYYTQNESEVNLYIYITINNFCKNINELGYNICVSLETYLENYRKKMLIKQYLSKYKNLKNLILEYDLENVKIYVKSTLKYLKDYFKMYDSFLFNYTMKNIHDFVLKNILNKT